MEKVRRDLVKRGINSTMIPPVGTGSKGKDIVFQRSRYPWGASARRALSNIKVKAAALIGNGVFSFGRHL
jgi:hypothetical protein